MLTSRRRRDFVKFLVVGGLNTAVGYGLFALFIIAGLPSALALALATMLGILFNFKSLGRLVFGGSGNGSFWRFVGVYAALFLLNLGALRLLEQAGLSALLAQALILPVYALASFLTLRRFVYQV